ncbi:MAG: UxaA family hydrolase [Betaproteobacteria bacterium]|jgi:altronate dehydratase|nr:D-galactarate dehydratase [Betaproteobacteria bacterium]NBT66850.1 D-galactarate dehydratase [Betaproteobacteria bacterium]NBY07997.1 D-galactarate dehydratase [Betaproteobacteria bacterium]
MKRISLTVHALDNVATVLDVATQDTLTMNGDLIDPGIPFGHKFALKTIEIGQDIIKYGVRIGVATQTITTGEHVHVHNCK